MLDLNDLRLFALVVDHGGFSAAARALGLPRSNVSRRIAGLEDGLAHGSCSAPRAALP